MSDKCNTIICCINTSKITDWITLVAGKPALFMYYVYKQIMLWSTNGYNVDSSLYSMFDLFCYHVKLPNILYISNKDFILST